MSSDTYLRINFLLIYFFIEIYYDINNQYYLYYYLYYFYNIIFIRNFAFLFQSLLITVNS